MADIFATPKRGTKFNLTYNEKTKSEARERKRNLLYLIARYLEEQNYSSTAELLKNEAQLSNEYEVCENLDLDIIIQEYCSYYYTKFQKYPKITRKVEKSELLRPVTYKGTKTEKKINKPEEKKDAVSPPECDYDFQFNIVSFDKSKLEVNNFTNVTTDSGFQSELEKKYPANVKWMVDIILQDVILPNTGISWDDCIGLENAVESIKESTVYPILYPDLFNNVTPWKAMLLFGPPGTGKTLLAKALANAGHTTFFNITSSTFVSKWRGDSEKMIKMLFDIAEHLAPSTIFFDEVDALMSNMSNVHEASQRFKSELLMHIDGVTSYDKKIFILATTNSPWQIDNALLRRFEKRILVNLPDEQNRTSIFKHFLNNVNVPNEDLKEFGLQSKLFSGSDIKTVCKEVLMSVIRDKIKRISSGDKTKKDNDKISPACIKEALLKMKPSVNITDCNRYSEWNQKHGCY